MALARDDAAGARPGRARRSSVVPATTRCSRCLGELDDAAARAETTAERAFLRTLGAGCAAPVAALATATTTPRVRLQGLVASVDGGQMVRVQGEGEPRELGERLAQDALAAGADRILAAIRG